MKQTLWTIGILLALIGIIFTGAGIAAKRKPCPALVSCSTCGCGVFTNEAKAVGEQYGSSKFGVAPQFFCKLHAPKYDFVRWTGDGPHYFNHATEIEVREDGSPLFTVAKETLNDIGRKYEDALSRIRILEFMRPSGLLLSNVFEFRGSNINTYPLYRP